MRVEKVIAVSDQYRTNTKALVIVLLIVLVAVSFCLWVFYYQVEDQLQRPVGEPDFDPKDKQEIRRLWSENTEMRLAQEVKYRVENNLRLTIKQLQDEVAGLDEELQFYKRLMAPLDVQKGLAIDSFVVHGQIGQRSIEFTMLLTQVTDSNNWVSGGIEIDVQGVELSTDNVRTFNAILEEDEPLLFRFRYFQEIKSRIFIPTSIEPKKIIVRVRNDQPEGRHLEQQFDWGKIIKKW